MTSALALDDLLIGLIGSIVKPASAVQRQRGHSLGYWLGLQSCAIRANTDGSSYRVNAEGKTNNLIVPPTSNTAGLVE